MAYSFSMPEIVAQLQLNLVAMGGESERGTDTIKTIQMLAGLLVETLFLFDEADVALETSFAKLADILGAEPYEGEMRPASLPPSHVVDFETECGRALARSSFEEWLDCPYDFHELIIYMISHHFNTWQNAGYSVAESFRIFIECAVKCMAYEISAQELCDIVIERKIASDGWTLADSISGLSALAGRRVALSLGVEGNTFPDKSKLPEYLEDVACIMTQEAVRLGIPAGSDWRFGLAANDLPVNAPIPLIYGLDPYCKNFFRVLGMNGIMDQAVACAKAAGRMVAVAAGGEMPEMEPVIAKPLAMSAMTESYRSVCIDRAIISC